MTVLLCVWKIFPNRKLLRSISNSAKSRAKPIIDTQIFLDCEEGTVSSRFVNYFWLTSETAVANLPSQSGFPQWVASCGTNRQERSRGCYRAGGTATAKH